MAFQGQRGGQASPALISSECFYEEKKPSFQGSGVQTQAGEEHLLRVNARGETAPHRGRQDSRHTTHASGSASPQSAGSPGDRPSVSRPLKCPSSGLSRPRLLESPSPAPFPQGPLPRVVMEGARVSAPLEPPLRRWARSADRGPRLVRPREFALSGHVPGLPDGPPRPGVRSP